MDNSKRLEFSILVPTYNSSKFIGRCLEAIFKLNFPVEDYEVIVIDGGSVDDTLNIVNSFKGVEIVYSSNVSISNSRNIGVSRSVGTNLVFIDSDCLVDCYLLIKAQIYLKKFECYGSFYKANNNHSWVAKTWLMAERKETGIVDWITSGTLLVSRDTFLLAGGFDETLQTEEDENFCFKVRQNGGKLFNDMSVASVHLGQPDSLMDFFNKEAWRGRSLIKPWLSEQKHKFSLFDAMIISYFLSFVVLSVAVMSCSISPVIISLFFTLLLPLFLSLRKLKGIFNLNLLLKMYVLQLIFLIARCWSIIKYNQLVGLLKKA